ncbi:MAG: hypothetical protein ABI967_10770 [bacterium]
MKPASGLSPTVEEELQRRHKATSTTVAGLLIATILLCIIAYLLRRRFVGLQNNPSLDIAVRITIMIFGLGSIVLRRTRFSAMRLQDIGALRGPSGLLRTLEKTTLQVAFIGGALALMGFGATYLTGNDFYTYGAGIVAIVILLYCYPTRPSWTRTVLHFAGDPDPETPQDPVAS